MKSKLTSLQQRILLILKDVSTTWHLTGGAALVGFYTKHRETRDLDLFFPQKMLHKHDVSPLIFALQEEDIQVDILQTSPTFHRYRLSDSIEVCLLDLVADPVPPIESPVQHELGFYIDTPYEIFINKLCALLSRSEARDLWDVMVLIKRGIDLEKGLEQAVQKDAGFSPLTLAWLLESLPLSELKMGVQERDELMQFHQDLIQRLTNL